MASSTVVVVVLGILVHVIYLFSVFDIYFTSPLVHGMTPYKSSYKPPAKRLVLFVADGLRADKLFELENGLTTRAPFLRNIIHNTGRWGVSHTRVPTESRPGHVAVIAGFYEDVSAVAKGWKENPVEFDSVFNESRNTWSWGSPDILPMFAKGASGSHVYTEMYEAEEEDFGGEDKSKLDTWVFEKVEKFLANSDDVIQKKLRSDKNVFFLHLLGLDTNGHAHRPISEEYMRNIRTVDNGVKKIVNIIEKYFDYDDSTVYILTSDHGMTNWGSHGAGNPHETLTPLVAWGAGIKGPELLEYDQYNDGLSAKWNLSHLKRCDVSQADITPLMASLIGVPFPLNSVGILPVDYLNNTGLYKAENLLINAKQILAQYEIKERTRKESSLVFRQFSELTGSVQVAYLRNISIATKAGRYEEAIILSGRLIDLSLKGLNYYQKYDRVLLSAIVTLGFLGWIGCVFLHVFQELHENRIKNINHVSVKLTINKIFLGIGGVIVALLFLENAPIMHYIYSLLALVCWNYVAKQHTLLRKLCVFSFNWQTFKLSISLLLVLLGLEVLVLSFFYRYVISVGILFLASWPLFTPLRKKQKTLVGLWVTHCLALSCFPLFPVVGRDHNYFLVTLAGALLFLLVVLTLVIFQKNQGHVERRTFVVFTVQLLILVAAIGILNHTVYNLSKKQRLPRLNQLFCWFTVISSVILPIISSDILLLRLISTTLSLIIVYLLLSMSYEGFFIVILASTMAVWLLLEHQLPQTNFIAGKVHPIKNRDFLSRIPVHHPQDSRGRDISFDDLRCSFFFVFFIILGFFGTGNIASINTFDPSSVYCFITVFSPFVMGALLIFKVIIPFIIVTCVFDAIHVVCHVPVNRLFLLVLVMTDLMALQFFFLVRDHGSWLEIGTSISHYVIFLLFIIFFLLIFWVARYFTRSTILGNFDIKSHLQ